MTQKGNVGIKRFNRNWQDGNPYVKSKNGVWTRPNSIFVKQNGEWVNTTKTESFYDNVIKYSAIFDAVDNTYLEDVAPEANRVPIAKWVLSVWLKRSAYLDVRQFVYGWIWSGTNSAWIEFDTSSKINIANYYSSGYRDRLLTTGTFKDNSNWYHLYFKQDLTHDTESERWVLKVNGKRIRDFDVENYPIQNDHESGAFYWFDGDFTERIGAFDKVNYDFTGYMADFHIVYDDTPDVGQFGRFRNGVWIPQKYTGGHGLWGHHLDFSDSSNFGLDISASGSDLTVGNFESDHQSIDTPENNFCTLDENATRTGMSQTNYGGLEIGYSSTAWLGAMGTHVMKSDKWYWEGYMDGGGSTDQYYCGGGIIAAGECSGDLVTGNGPWYNATGLNFFTLWSYNPIRFYNYSSYVNSTNLTGVPAASDTFMYAFDADNQKFWIGRNGVWGLTQTRVSNPDPASGAYPNWDNADGIDVDKYDWVPFFVVYQKYGLRVNFGQNDFRYAPPTGFKKLCSKNLPEPNIPIPKKYFEVTTWTGNGLDKQTIGIPSGNGLDFSPDLTIIKNLDTTTQWGWFDVRRGPHIQLDSMADSNPAEVYWSQYGFLSSFDDRGFTVSGGTTNETLCNTDGDRYAGFNWKIGADFGIDVVLYEGTGTAQNISHNLKQTPKMIIVKNRDNSAQNWFVYHYANLNKTDPETDYIRLNLANGGADLNTLWNDTAPTDTQFTVGTADAVNESGAQLIAYLFGDIPGFSKVFHYEGNGSALGPYIYCGFNPKFIMFKNSDGSNSWRIFDTVRTIDNGHQTQRLLPDLNYVEANDGIAVNWFSNGFKVGVNTAYINTNNDSFMGVAFADHPFKYSNAGM